MATITIAEDQAALVSDFFRAGDESVRIDRLDRFTSSSLVYAATVTVGGQSQQWVFTYRPGDAEGDSFSGNAARGFSGRVDELEVRLDANAGTGVAPGALLYEVSGLDIPLDAFLTDPDAALGLFAGTDIVRPQSGPLVIDAEALRAFSPGPDRVAGSEGDGDRVTFAGTAADYVFAEDADGEITVRERAAPPGEVPLTLTLTGIETVAFEDGTVLDPPAVPAPRAVDDTVAAAADTIDADALLANDTSFRADTATGEPVPLGVVAVTGTDVVFDRETGVISANPALFVPLGAGEELALAFSYEVSDGDPATNATAEVSLTVTGVNDPVAIDPDDPDFLDEGTIAELGDGQPGAGTALRTAEGTIPFDDPDAVDSFAAEVVGAPVVAGAGQIAAPVGGFDLALLPSAREVDWTFSVGDGALDGFSAQVAFTQTYTVRIADAAGTSDTAPVTIAIRGTDDAPEVAATGAAASAGGGPATLFPTASVDTVDADESGAAQTVSSLLLRLSGVADGAAETLSIGGRTLPLAAGTGLSFTGALPGEPATGTAQVVGGGPGTPSVLLSGLALTGAEAAALIEGIAYANAAEEPTPGTRSVTLETLTDSGLDTGPNANTAAVGVTATVTVDGAADNRAPDAVADAATLDRLAGATGIDVLSNDSDPDGDPIAVTAIGTGGTLGLVTLTDGAVAYDPNGKFDGLAPGETATDSFSYTIADPDGLTDSATVTVTITGAGDGQPPVAGDDTASVDRFAGAVGIDVLGNDADPDGGALAVTALDTGATLGLATLTDGAIAYDPNGQFDGLAPGTTATDSFAYTITDADGLTDSATVTVTITAGNRPPVAGDNAATVDRFAEAVAIAVLGNDTDPDGDDLAVGAIDTAGTLGLVTLVDGAISYDPNGQFDGLAPGTTATDSFAYTVTDPGGLSDTATVTVTVVSDNRAPVAADDTVAVDRFAEAVTVPVLGNDSDPDGDDLAVTAVDATGTAGLVTLVDGAIAYDPNGQFDGLAPGTSATDSFGYTVTDAAGLTASATVAVTITAGNRTPVAVNDARTVSEDAGPTAIAVLENDGDPDGDALSVTGLVTFATQGTAVLDGDTVVYSPGGAFEALRAGQESIDTFTYTVADPDGATAQGIGIVTVVGINDAPVALPDAATVLETGQVVIPVLANDSDPEGEALSVTDVSGAEGTVLIGADGTLVYTPGAAFPALDDGETAIDGFTYTVADASGASSTGTVTVTVLGEGEGNQNAAPICGLDEATVAESGTVLLDIIAAASDPDGDLLELFDVDTAGLIGDLAIDFQAGTVTYDPAGQFEALNDGETATDTFRYTVTDGNGGFCDQTVTITITGEDDGPPVISIGDAAEVETDPGGVSFVNFPVTLDRAATVPVTFEFTVTDTGTGPTDATDGIDYGDVTDTFTIPAGAQLVFVPVEIFPDTDDEDDETFAASISSITGAVAGIDAAVGTIIDDDVVAGPVLSVGDASIDEGFPGDTDRIAFRVSLDSPAPAPVSFTYRTVEFFQGPTTPASATEGLDYSAISSAVATIPQGQSFVDVFVDILGDGETEPDEVFGLAATDLVGARSGDTLGVGTIVDGNNVLLPFEDSFGSDDVTGTPGDDRIDLLADGLADRFQALGGFDTLDLSGLALAQGGTASVDLGNDLTDTPVSGIDATIDFEAVIGTDSTLFRDDISGDGEDNFIDANAGPSVDIDVLAPFGSLSTSARDNWLLAGGDLIFDGAGQDEIIAGPGDTLVTLAADGVSEVAIAVGGVNPTLDVSNAVSGVTVDLDNQLGSGPVLTGGGFGNQTGASVSGFTGVWGGGFADTITADEFAFDGGGADSVTLNGTEALFILAPDATAETLLAGNGTAELFLGFATESVEVLLFNQDPTFGGTVFTSPSLGSQVFGTVTGVSSVTGTPFGDRMSGDDSDNYLGGLDGDDTLIGRGGVDEYEGGPGADTVFLDIVPGDLGILTDFVPGVDEIGTRDLLPIDNPLDASYREIPAGARGSDGFALGEGLTVFGDTLSGQSLSAVNIAGFLDSFADDDSPIVYAPGAGGPVLVAVGDGSDTAIAFVDDTLPGFGASEVSIVAVLEGLADPTALSAGDFLDFTQDTGRPTVVIDSATGFIADPVPETFVIRIDNMVDDGGLATNPDFDGLASLAGFQVGVDIIEFRNEPGSTVTLDEVVSGSVFEQFIEDPFNATLTVIFADDPNVPGSTGAVIDFLGFSEFDPAFVTVTSGVPNTEAPAPVMGTEGDDLFEGVPDGALIDGLGGIDTVAYDWGRGQVALDLAEDGTVTLTGPDERADTLVSVERVALEDGVWRLGLGDLGTYVYTLYTAAFGRNPLEAGLAHWTAAAGVMGRQKVAMEFVDSAEFGARLGEDRSAEAVVTSLFDTVLDRAPKPEGLAHWTGEAETLGLDGLLMAFAGSPENLANAAEDIETGLWLTG